ncbi:MAG: tRNA (N(6)-L-threonylcarbamoyladenosine(37)-C(2))-methylthiotransferase MtaB [Epsilonproteobacteria bacterium]|nr:tRNA (N(6)-L-threonylcarbamoyladenosine(37)-C(2))-methylthiotransferase MtaB [Campylobacterota bacterium]
MKVFFKTFGCRTNLFDTQVMLNSLKDFEVVQKESEADIIVVNSCTVTNGADSSVRNYINRLKNKKVYLTGCGAFTKGEELLRAKKVNGVFGHSEKKRVNSLLKEENFFKLGDLETIDSTIIEEFKGKSRAFVKIQEGCDFKCSYCIIPSVRGLARSVNEEQILKQIEKLASNGFGEFIFTGTNVGSYGKDTNTSLAKLFKKVSQIRGVRRIRVGSLEPSQIDEEFKEILKEPWMAKHLHIALQHTSDKMLEIMNRRNRVKEDLKLFEEIAGYGFALGSDFIVGHPGEDEEIFKEAFENLKKFPLTHIHLFTYSKRSNTPSASMKNTVSKQDAKRRYHQIKALIAEKNYHFRKKHPSLEVLVEGRKGEAFFGYDQFFNPVWIESSQDLKGNWIYLDEYEVKKEGNFAKC